jgi:hypothetical protein
MPKLTDAVRDALQKDEDLSDIKGISERQLYRSLIMLIHDATDIVRQRACRRLAERITRMESAQIELRVRRLLWRLNPESGDYPVGLPELLGEIGNRAPREIESFVSVVLYYLDDEKLLPGLLQAAGRFGQKLPEVLSEYISEIAGLLRHKNTVIAGNAALALRRIGGSEAERALNTLRDDTRKIMFVCGEHARLLELREFADEQFHQTQEECFVASEPPA